MRKYPISLGVALVVGSLCSCGGAAPPAEMPVSTLSPLLERPLPEISRPTMSGRRLDADALAGRVVVVKFFARYCRPCQRTLPDVQALHASREDVVVVGVSLDENVSDVLRQISRYRLTFPVIHDRGRLLAGRFRVVELPISFVTDRSHRIVWVGGPGTTAAMLRQAVAAALRRDPALER